MTSPAAATLLPNAAAPVTNSSAASPSVGPTAPSRMQPPPPSPAGTDYGLLDPLRDARTGLASAFQDFVSRLGTSLERVLDDASTVEVATFTSDDMQGVSVDAATGRFSGTAQLRALTRVGWNGDTLACIPERDGQIDTALWAIHSDMVNRAQTQRAELFKAAVSVAAGMLQALKPD